MDLVRKTFLLGAVLLPGGLIGPPVAAQFSEQEWLRTPEAKPVKPRKPPTTKPARPAGTRAPDQEVKTEVLESKQLNAKNASDWIELGGLQLMGGNLAGAEGSFERAIALSAKGDRAARLATALAMNKLSRIDRARFIFRSNEAKSVAAFAGNADDLTKAARGDFDKAKGLIEQALALNKELDHKEGMASDYADLGDLHLIAGDIDQGRALLEQALELNKALERKKEMAANYSALAGLHQRANDFDRAEAMLKEALALNEALALKAALVDNYEALAALCLKRGELDEAERLYKQALALGEQQDKITVLRALERLYKDRGDLAQSDQVKAQARAIEKERGGGKLLFSFDLGLYQSGFTAKEQLETLQKVVPLEKALRHEVGLASSYTLMGLHYSYRADLDEEKGDAELARQAEAMFKDALALTKKLGRENHTAFLYPELVLLMDKRGDLAEVEATLKDTLALYEKLGQGSGIAKVYASLGYGRKSRGDNAQACAYWHKAALANPDDQMLVNTLNLNKCAAAR